MQAYDWQSKLSADEVIRRREAMLVALEEASARIHDNGLANSWLDGCDESVKQLCASINGPLFEQLAAKADACIEDVRMLRTGAFVWCCFMPLCMSRCQVHPCRAMTITQRSKTSVCA